MTYVLFIFVGTPGIPISLNDKLSYLNFPPNMYDKAYITRTPLCWALSIPSSFINGLKDLNGYQTFNKGYYFAYYYIKKNGIFIKNY
jgi:hypothetical protein